MLDRHFLQSFLKLNHTSDSMTDAEVTEVLQKAGWTQPEIDSALILLNKGAVSDGKGVLSPLSSGMEFSSAQLSNLLGIDVTLDPNILRHESMALSARNIAERFLYGCIIVFLSLVFAAAIGFAALNFLQIGPFSI